MMNHRGWPLADQDKRGFEDSHEAPAASMSSERFLGTTAQDFKKGQVQFNLRSGAFEKGLAALGQ